MSYDEGLDSIDKRERAATLDLIANEANFSDDDKIAYLNKGLNDKHDFVRSKAVELLGDIKIPEVFELLLKRLTKETFWGTRFLILKKLTDNIDLCDTNKYLNDLTKFINDPKPKVRIQAAYLLSNEKIGAWAKIGEIFYDKDPDVRKEVQGILEKSPDPEIQKKIQEHLDKLKEKEKKKREVESMFDGI
ncbi:MAG: HEAT repeat domain-containing protein [Candidatus Hodarchaeales archaeon]|jgi:HEAT repeat protein